MNADLIEFHTAHKTPLARLGASVRWLEEKANHSSGAEKKRFVATAKDLRLTISRIFFERDRDGQYLEA